MQPLKYWSSSVCANKWSPWYFSKWKSEMLKNETSMLSSVLENWECRVREGKCICSHIDILWIDRASNGCKWGRGTGREENIFYFTLCTLKSSFMCMDCLPQISCFKSQNSSCQAIISKKLGLLKQQTNIEI